MVRSEDGRAEQPGEGLERPAAEPGQDAAGDFQFDEAHAAADAGAGPAPGTAGEDPSFEDPNDR